jgi:anti-sigma-K factor RskA
MPDDLEFRSFADMALDYALGSLSQAELQHFETALARDPDLKAEIDAWAAPFTARAQKAMTPVILPAALRARLAALEKPKAPPPAPFSPVDQVAPPVAPPIRNPVRERWGLFQAATFGLLAALFVLWAVERFISPGSGVEGYRATIAATDQSLLVEAAYFPNDSALMLDRKTGAAQAGRVFQLWLMAGDVATSLGVLPDAPRARFAVDPALADKFQGSVLVISDEPAGGSPTDAPSGAILAQGPLQLP